MSKLRIDGLRRFSKQESQVFNLLIAEYRNEEIADIMGIHQKTVGVYKLRLLSKTGSKSIIGLYLFSLRPDIQKFLR